MLNGYPVKIGADWGACVAGEVKVGDVVTVTTRGGKSWQATVTALHDEPPGPVRGRAVLRVLLVTRAVPCPGLGTATIDDVARKVTCSSARLRAWFGVMSEDAYEGDERKRGRREGFREANRAPFYTFE